ncbi:MAG: hypothetical protein WCO35_01475 [Candidatus Nomurabacteria bacterium]
MKNNIFNPEEINLQNNKDINEKLIQEIISENPSILGLGDLILRDKERIQPRAGRLDLLLQDPESGRRYEVEIQLGKTDESHIIRTIEYWDTERKRYPQYDHCAVIIAEEITTRFNNVINLFNGSIPLIAIQMKAYKFEEKTALIFTTVLNENKLGDEDNEIEREVTDKNYWIKRASERTVSFADDMLNLIKTFDERYELKFNKFYIGLAKNGIANNFVDFVPQKNAMILDLKSDFSEDLKNQMLEDGLDYFNYDRWQNYKIRITEDDFKNKRETLIKYLKIAYDYAGQK